MMTTLIRYLLGAAVVAAAGFGTWRAGTLHTRTAAAHRQLLVLQYDAPGAGYDAIEGEARALGPLPILSRVDREAREQRGAARYWQGRYADLELEPNAAGEVTETNAALLLLAANAAYRTAALDDSGPAAVQRADSLLGQYADVLRRGAWQFDAAYNYEVVARRRDALIRARGARTQKPPTPAPAGPPSTLHGRAGAVPPGADMTEFKIIVPRQSDERREQPEAGKGGARARKG
jgi:hypothetical protein